MRISERGYWMNNSAEGHATDDWLAGALLEFFNTKGDISVVDVGCGTGYYTKYLVNNLIKCSGFDGNPYTYEITNGLCRVVDFSKPVDLGNKFNWAMSLEVAEHIPEQFEDIFLTNLDNLNTDGIVISWSIPEYGGDGHVNPRTNEYVVDKFTSMGYSLNTSWTVHLRNNCHKFPTPCYWFSRTAFVFDRVTK